MDCSVCYEKIQVVKTPCGHHICINCLINLPKLICTICRKDIDKWTTDIGIKALVIDHRKRKWQIYYATLSNEELMIKECIPRNGSPKFAYADVRLLPDIRSANHKHYEADTALHCELEKTQMSFAN
jgi:hypothetical protein